MTRESAVVEVTREGAVAESPDGGVIEAGREFRFCQPQDCQGSFPMRPLASLIGMAGALWRYRQFIRTSIRAELQGRFARSRLGAAWHILHPLAQSAILAMVLSEVMGARLPGSASSNAYPIYLMAGSAAWGLFSEILTRCITVFITYAGSLKKISFPRLCLPVIVWGSALLNHFLLLAAMTLVFLLLGQPPGPTWLALPLGVLLISLFAFGLGLLLGIINVFSRDVAEASGIVLQIWFWLTPIVYAPELVPERFRWLLGLNPLLPFVRLYQDALLYRRWPDLMALLPSAGLALLLVALAFLLFRRAGSELVDAL
jgi:lipopolysaccharide transport system permease protein